MHVFSELCVSGGMIGIHKDLDIITFITAVTTSGRWLNQCKVVPQARQPPTIVNYTLLPTIQPQKETDLNVQGS